MSLILFAAFAGAIQMVAPDHWMPASIFSWQRGWTVSRTVLFAAFLALVHVLSGCFLYWAFDGLLAHIPETHLSLFTFLLVAGFGLIRTLRFSRVRQVIHRTPRFRTGFMAVLWLLGPSEMVIPVLLKADLHQMTIGFPLLVFFAATWSAGSLCIGVSRLLWNRPSFLPRTVDWCQKQFAAYPVAAGALVSVLLVYQKGLSPFW
jgi:hypothetical protein